VGVIVQSGTAGASLQEEREIESGLTRQQSLKVGAYDPKQTPFIDRLNQATGGQSTGALPYQVAADLLLKGAGSFYGSTGNVKQESTAAAEWFGSQVAALRTQGMATNEDQVHTLISMMMDQMYSNYNDPLNPGVSGGDNLPRNLANMGAGYQEFAASGQTNDRGGVCDHIAATGCQLWNKIYPDKPCFIVNVQGAGTQHWLTATHNGDGTYTLMDAGSIRNVTAEGNAISSPGNAQLFVPIAKVNAAGDATIVATPPSELMNYIRHLSRPDSEEGQLFRGLSQSGFSTFRVGKNADRPLLISVGGGRGRMSQQNLGQEVWGVFANVDKTGKFIENKLTIFYTEVGAGTADPSRVAGLENTTAVFKAFSLVPNLKIDLRAGINLAAGAILPNGKIEDPLYDIGYTGGGHLFAQTAISGQKQLNPKTALKGRVVFRAEGLPGLVITQMHGIDNGYGLKNGFQGVNARFINQNEMQLTHQTERGTHTFGLQGGASQGPLNPEGRPDWNLGGNYRFDNGNERGFRGIQTQATYQNNQNIFNQGSIGRLNVGSTFAVSRPGSRNLTLITPSLSGQLSNYGNQTQFFGGGGVIIQFDRKRR
jgi:hypothetical protein